MQMKQEKFLSGKGELIDTLWNVNYVNKNLGTEQTRINRYIMECK